MNNRNFIIVIVTLAVVAAISLASYLPARTDIGERTRINDFPMKIGEWSATDMPLSQRDYEILETKNLFVRDYHNPKGEHVFLYMIYSEDNRKVSHPPEVCMMGSGVTVVNKESVRITDSVKAIKLLLEKDDSRQLIVYWYKAGELQTDTYLKQQLKIVVNRTFGRRISGALIRLSCDINGQGEKAALDLLKRFSAKIEPLLPKYVP